jgi:hypothetical protein
VNKNFGNGRHNLRDSGVEGDNTDDYDVDRVKTTSQNCGHQRVYLLVIFQVIHEHEEPWWNNIDREELLIRTSHLSGYATAEPSTSKSRGTWRNKL